MLSFFLFGTVEAVSNSIPVHQLPYACSEVGFPLVLGSGILGCDQTGTINQWLDFSTGQVAELPTGQWIVGDKLYMTGISGGMWDLELNQFEDPRQRILVQIVDGSARVRDNTVLWSTSESVHILNTGSRAIKEIAGSPLLGQAPDLFQD